MPVNNITPISVIQDLMRSLYKNSNKLIKINYSAYSSWL